MKSVATIAALLLASACASAPPRVPAAQARLGQDFRLEQGQGATVEGEPLGLRFTGVLEDSRCPVGRQCIRAGEAKVHVELRLPGHDTEDVVLATEGGQPHYASFDRYDVRLVALDPPPQPGVSRPRYVATLRVTKR